MTLYFNITFRMKKKKNYDIIVLSNIIVNEQPDRYKNYYPILVRNITYTEYESFEKSLQYLSLSLVEVLNFKSFRFSFASSMIRLQVLTVRVK